MKSSRNRTRARRASRGKEKMEKRKRDSLLRQDAFVNFYNCRFWVAASILTGVVARRYKYAGFWVQPRLRLLLNIKDVRRLNIFRFAKPIYLRRMSVGAKYNIWRRCVSTRLSNRSTLTAAIDLLAYFHVFSTSFSASFKHLDRLACFSGVHANNWFFVDI